jgi:hypothetical protein
MTGGPDMQPLLAYIGGSERCGSTLLDLALNNSPEVQSVGEVSRLCLYARTDHETCTCGQRVTECPFWLEVEDAARCELGLADGTPLLSTYETMLWPERLGLFATAIQKGLLVLGNRPLYLTGARLLARSHDEACRNSLFWFGVIRRVTRCPVILDSSKDARRLKALYLTEPGSFRLIHLLRDGRAIVASAMRRKGIDVVTACRDWLKIMRSLDWVIRSIPQHQTHRVYYERLCTEPEETLRALCEFLGIAFVQDMLTLRKQIAHNIGGNPMRFRRGESAIKLDDRWRREMSAGDLATFERMAGAVNRRLGYTD